MRPYATTWRGSGVKRSLRAATTALSDALLPAAPPLNQHQIDRLGHPVNERAIPAHEDLLIARGRAKHQRIGVPAVPPEPSHGGQHDHPAEQQGQVARRLRTEADDDPEHQTENNETPWQWRGADIDGGDLPQEIAPVLDNEALPCDLNRAGIEQSGLAHPLLPRDRPSWGGCGGPGAANAWGYAAPGQVYGNPRDHRAVGYGVRSARVSVPTLQGAHRQRHPEPKAKDLRTSRTRCFACAQHDMCLIGRAMLRTPHMVMGGAGRQPTAAHCDRDGGQATQVGLPEGGCDAHLDLS